MFLIKLKTKKPNANIYNWRLFEIRYSFRKMYLCALPTESAIKISVDKCFTATSWESFSSRSCRAVLESLRWDRMHYLWNGISRSGGNLFWSSKSFSIRIFYFRDAENNLRNRLTEVDWWYNAESEFKIFHIEKPLYVRFRIT